MVRLGAGTRFRTDRLKGEFNMSSNRKIFDGDFSRERIKAEGFGNMFAGALFGGALVGGVGVFIAILMVISSWLPPESKEADDPTPDSFSAYILPYDETQA